MAANGKKALRAAERQGEKRLKKGRYVKYKARYPEYQKKYCERKDSQLKNKTSEEQPEAALLGREQDKLRKRRNSTLQESLRKKSFEFELLELISRKIASFVAKVTEH